MIRQEEDGQIFWNFPGGHMEAGETPEQTCIREVKEETGYEIAIAGLFCEIKKGSHPGSSGLEYVYLADIVGGEEKLEDGLLESRWVPLDENMIWDVKTLPVIEMYRRDKNDYIF
jgi:8-oxo-dGTP pyrophosphatase MutT (NUDIX family)